MGRSTMSKEDHKAVSAKGLMAVTIFYAINILLFPIALIGYVIWVGKAVRTSRALRLPKDRQVRSFEVDTPKTQMIKREMLSKTRLDVTGITFVAADVEKEDWFTRLVDAGFDQSKPALFLWEGVVMYLDQEAVEDTLSKIGSCASGSVVAFDYFTTEVLSSPALYWRFARMSTRAVGEPLKFGIESRPSTRESLAELLQPCGLSLVEQHILGKESGKKRAWGGFALAIVS